MLKKLTALALLLTCTLSLSACNNSGGNTGSENVPQNNASEENKVFANLDDGFILLKDAVVDSPFDELGDDYIGKTFSAESVLYNDLTSEISAEFDGMTAYVTIDGKSYETNAESPVAINIVDLDTTDSYRELAIYSEGPSGDPSVSFIRYDGAEIIPITSYNADYDYTSTSVYGWLAADESDVYPTYGAIWTNQKGRIITSFQNIGFTDKRIAMRCYDIKDNEFVETVLDNQNTFPNKFTITESFSAFYTPCTETPADLTDLKYFADFDFGAQKEFEKGQKIEILDTAYIYGYYNYYISYDGEKGVIAFWLGD